MYPYAKNQEELLANLKEAVEDAVQLAPDGLVARMLPQVRKVDYLEGKIWMTYPSEPWMRNPAGGMHGGMIAAMLLKTDLTSEELEAFYADVDAQPAEEGDVVTLSAKALDESSLEALQKAKLYEEGAQYQFVYLYSAPPEE